MTICTTRTGLHPSCAPECVGPTGPTGPTGATGPTEGLTQIIDIEGVGELVFTNGLLTGFST